MSRSDRSTLKRPLHVLGGRLASTAAAVRRVLSTAKDRTITILPKRLVQVLADNRWHVPEDIGSRIAAYQESNQAGKRKIVFYTAVFGGRDTLLLPDFIDPDVDYVCFTDRPRNTYGIWQMRSISFSHPDPTRVARYVKMHPHELFPEHEVAVWVDANILMRGDIRKYIEAVTREQAQLGLVRHPVRGCFYEEAEACKRFGKDRPALIDEQIEYYRKGGLPVGIPLYETGFMVVRLRDARTVKALQLWWRQIECFTRRDQLGFAWVTYQLPDLRVIPLLPEGTSVRNHHDFRYYRHSYARALIVPAAIERHGVISEPKE